MLSHRLGDEIQIYILAGHSSDLTNNRTEEYQFRLLIWPANVAFKVSIKGILVFFHTFNDFVLLFLKKSSVIFSETGLLLLRPFIGYRLHVNLLQIMHYYKKF